MKIDHIALWVQDLEQMRRFYETYFEAKSNDRYKNEQKQFTSYFLTFPDSACRLELMHRTDVQESGRETLGYTHIAFSLGSKAAVEALTARLQEDGYPLLDGPRMTGDGYYESVMLDPEQNKLELTI